MTHRIAISLFTLLVPAVAAGPLVAQQGEEDRRPGVAVMRFDRGGSHGPGAEAEDFEGLEVGLQQMLLTELSQNPELRVVERGRINELVREQGLVDEGRVDPSTAARIGQMVGARYMVIGSFFEIVGEMRIDLRVVDVETSEIVATAGQADERARMLGLLVGLADEVAESVDLPPLPDDVREAREEQAEEVPIEGITEYSHALMLIDEGSREEGLESLERVVERFPQWSEAKQVLEEERAAAGQA